MQPAVTIVILNWNGKSYLEQFLPSVLATEYSNFSVLLVDNASTDDSVAWLKEQYPQVQVEVMDQNYGFTGGNNRALPYVKTPYYVLLNSDVEVEPGWLTPLVTMMESDPSIASIQPKVRAWHEKEKFEYAGAAGGYMDCYGYPFNRGRLFDITEKDEGQYDDPKEIFWATGACCLIRKEVSDRIGLFEERFFAHMEEIDFCWRAKNFGYRIMYCPDSIVYHVGGGTLKRENPFKTFLNVRNSLAANLKNLSGGKAFVKIWIRLILDGVWGVRSLLRGEFKTTWAIIRAHWAFFFSIPYWLKRKKEIYRDLDRIPPMGAGYYRRSIVWQHFAKKAKKFSELKDIS